MTQKQFNTLLDLSKNDFAKDTCYKLRITIVQKIVNCKNIPDIEKGALLNQYTHNLTTNSCAIESIKQYNNK